MKFCLLGRLLVEQPNRIARIGHLVPWPSRRRRNVERISRWPGFHETEASAGRSNSVRRVLVGVTDGAQEGVDLALLLGRQRLQLGDVVSGHRHRVDQHHPLVADVERSGVDLIRLGQ
jgi:hypothetical protein